MILFSIDPGPERSGWVMFDSAGGRIFDSGVSDNHDVLRWIRADSSIQEVAIETMQATYSSTVGRDVIRTMMWAGRYWQAWSDTLVGPTHLVSRQEAKAYVCNGNTKASDAGVRQALIDLLGPPGTKRAPGPTYGVTSHAWAALAVAVAACGFKGKA